MDENKLNIETVDGHNELVVSFFVQNGKPE